MARDKIHIDLVLNTKGFRPLGRINGQLGEFEKSLDASNARVLAFGASAGAILAVKKAFTATVKAAIEVEKSLKDINVILGATSSNLKKFGSDLFEIASKTGQAFQVAATAATELARQGLGTAETLKRTRDALILARLAGMDAAEAVNALTAAINTFNKAGLDSTTIINKLANVDAAFAVSSDDLAKAIGRVGASAKAAGVNFDQLLAIVTTVQQKTARGGAVIGNSFKTIFTRIQRPRVIKELENLGIAIRGVEGDVLPAMKVLQNLARQFDHLSQAQKAQVTEMIGGVFQVNILKAAMSDLSKETGIYNRALSVSLGSSDQALRRNEELNKTLSAQFQRTVNTFKEGAAELGELTLGPALQRMFGFVDEMSKIGESDFGKTGVAIAKSIFEGLGKFISGPGLLVVGLVLFKTFSQLGKFAADAFKTLTGLNKSLQTQQNLQRQVFDVLSENPDLLKKIKDGTMTVEEAHEEIFKQIEKNTGALDAQLLVSQQLAKSLVSGGVGFSTDFGATSGKKDRKFGSAGYIPSFAADGEERLGMMVGGYSGSQVNNPQTRQQTLHDGRGGAFNATVNGHESVFTTQNGKGKKATFVVPPKNSKAHGDYMSALSGGFIPSFSPLSRRSISNASRQAFGQSRKFGNKFSLAERAGAAVSGAGMGSRILADAGTSLVTGGAAGLPGAAFAADMAGLHGPEIAKGLKRKFKGGKFSEGYGKGTRLEQGFMGASVMRSGGFIPSFARMRFSSAKRIQKQKEYLEQLRREEGLPTNQRPFADDRKQVSNLFGMKTGTYGMKMLTSQAQSKHNQLKHAKDLQDRGDVTGEGKFVDLKGTKRFDTRKGKRVEQKGTRVYDAKGKFGLLGLYGRGSDQGYAEAPLSSVSEYAGIPGPKKIGFKNLQYRAVTQELSDSERTQQFSKDIRTHLGPPTEDLANAFSKRVFKDDAIKSAPIAASGTALFPKGAEGEIFETVTNALTAKNASAASFEKSLAMDPNKTWDFEETGGPDNLFRERFKFSTGLMKADAKRTLSDKAGSSLVNKIFNTTKDDMAGQFAWRSELDANKRSTPRKSGGYIPNFNALFEAVRREKEAGVPSGRIRVGRSERLRNGSNPSGFGIYNTRDEPMGLNQGISNSVAAGVDPKKRGRSHGFIPNFMVDPTIIKEKTEWAKEIKKEIEATKKSSTEVKKLTRATQQQADTGGRTIAGMMLLQQGISGLDNSMGENNQKAKAVVQALGSVANALIAAQFMGGQLKQSGMGKLTGKGKEAVETGKRSLGQQLQRDNQAKFLRKQKLNTKKFGAKGGGMKGAMARGGAGMGRMAGMASAGAAGAAASGLLMGVVAVAAGLNAFGKLMTETDFSATVKEARLAGKSLAKIRETTEKNISKLNRFGTAAEQAAETFEDENATMSQVLDASRKMEEEMLKLPAEFRTKLQGIFDPKAVNRMIEAFVAKQQKNAQTAQERKDAADLFQDTRTKGGLDVLAHPIESLMNLATAGNLEGKTPEEIKMDKKSTESMAARMLNTSIDKDQGAFMGIDTEALAAKMGAAQTVQEKVQIGREMNFSDPDFAIWEKWMYAGGAPADNLIESMQKLASETQKGIRISEQLKPIREAFLKQNRDQLKVIRDTKKQLESEQRIRSQVIKITAEGAKSFLNAAAKIKLDTTIKIGEARADKETQFGGVVSQGTKALTSAAGLRNIVDESGNPISGVKNFSGSGLESGIRGTFAQANAGGVGSVSQQKVDQQNAQLDEMIDSIKNNTGSGNVGAQAQIKELQGLKSELSNLVGTSNRLDDELKMQTKEIRAAAAAQKMVADQQRRLKSFGGPQALLDPSKLNPQLSKIISGGKAMAAGGRAGSRTGFNRGRINQLSGVQDLLGGELPAHLQKEGVARATQVGVTQIGAMNQALGLGMSPEQVRQTAAEQAANLFKGDPQKENTKALGTLTATLKGNSDLIKHSRTDRVKLGGMEAQHGSEKVSRQQSFFEQERVLTASAKEQTEDEVKLFGNMRDTTKKGTIDTGMMPDWTNHFDKDLGNFMNYIQKAISNPATGIPDFAGLVTAPGKIALAEMGFDTGMPKFGDVKKASNMDPNAAPGTRGSEAFEAVKAAEGAKGRMTQEQKKGLADDDKAAIEALNDKVSEMAVDGVAGVTTNNFNFDGNGTVTTDGMPSDNDLVAGIDGIEALREQLRATRGAVESLPGGTQALNAQGPVA